MIQLKHIFILFGIVVISVFSFEASAQSSRDSEPEVKFSKFSTKELKSKRKSKYNKPQAIAEYEKLKKEVQREQTKKEKGMKKPQYSDPLYFGHKKKPKKRKNGKKKFCKECGMTH